MDDRPFGALRTHALVPCVLISMAKTYIQRDSPATRSVRGIASISTAITPAVPSATASTIEARDICSFCRHLERGLR